MRGRAYIYSLVQERTLMSSKADLAYFSDESTYIFIRYKAYERYTNIRPHI